MAKKGMSSSLSTKSPTVPDIPETLEKHIFYGLILDEDQKAFRDAIYSKDYDIVFCNAKAGTGKTLISVATAMLMCELGLFDGILYVTAAGVFEHKQGLLPGTLEEKSRFSFMPLQQALLTLNYDPERLICSDANIAAQKDGTSMIMTQTDSYIRGINYGSADKKMIIIIEESQNFTREGLKTVLSRINDGSKTVVIGHNQQCDLKYVQDSGFVPYLEHYRKKERCAVCSLTKNYRGWVSAWADEL